jgi:hypothetical protein
MLRRVGLEAFLMAVARFWPARGTRNEAAMALCRVLLEALAPHHPNDAERIEIVDMLVLEVAMQGGDGEASRHGKERAAATLAKMQAGEDTTGLPRLIELLELPKDVAKEFRKWLGLAVAPIAAARIGLPIIYCVAGEIPRMTNEAEAAPQGGRGDLRPWITALSAGDRGVRGEP